jgi:hypothetical protein
MRYAVEAKKHCSMIELRLELRAFSSAIEILII